MTDSPSSDTPGDGPPAQPQPWFPPADLGAAPPPPPPPPGSAGPPPGQPGYSQPGHSQPGYSRPGYGQPGYGYPGPRQPGYPPPPGPAPHYGDPAPKPGVIPLRPLGLGEILDGSFATIRRNPKATLGIAAIIVTISAVITSALTLNLVSVASLGNHPTLHQLEQFLAGLLPVLGVTVLLTLVVQAVLAGLLAPVIAREAGGQQISAADAWRAAAPRLPSVLAATLLALLAGLGPLLALGLILLIAFVAGAPAVAYVAIGRARLLRRWPAQHLVLRHVQPGDPGRRAGTGAPRRPPWPDPGGWSGAASGGCSASCCWPASSSRWRPPSCSSRSAS